MKQSVLDVKPFIGSKEFTQSRDFYVAMGWTLVFDNSELARLELEGHGFYLQNYYQKQWCDNTMLHIAVENAQYWYEHVTKLLDTGLYGNSRVRKPTKQDSGEFVTFVWDPAGILLQFAQPA